MAESKVDFKRSMDAYRAESGAFRVVDVPPIQYLMIDGHGDPNTAKEFEDAVGALYSLAYPIKMASKRDLGRDYTVMPLEGLWWADDMANFTSARDKSTWDWTLMIMTPDWITESEVAAARARGAGDALDAVRQRVRLETLEEGRCVQTLHLGSFDDEAAVLEQLHDRFIPDHGFAMRGRHHEIYLSDARRVPPERRRTILRQPVV